jgi:hypothetical protein
LLRENMVAMPKTIEHVMKNLCLSKHTRCDYYLWHKESEPFHSRVTIPRETT